MFIFHLVTSWIIWSSPTAILLRKKLPEWRGLSESRKCKKQAKVIQNILNPNVFVFVFQQWKTITLLHWLLFCLSPGTCYKIVAVGVVTVLVADNYASLAHFCTEKQLERFLYSQILTRLLTHLFRRYEVPDRRTLKPLPYIQ